MSMFNLHCCCKHPSKNRASVGAGCGRGVATRQVPCSRCPVVCPPRHNMEQAPHVKFADPWAVARYLQESSYAPHLTGCDSLFERDVCFEMAGYRRLMLSGEGARNRRHNIDDRRSTSPKNDLLYPGSNICRPCKCFNKDES